MTERDLYDAALIEINKLEAPSMLLEDYNYFINKAIQQYINKAYNRYEINQQATDDLSALKVSEVLTIDFDKKIVTKDGIKQEVAEPASFPGEKKNYYCMLENYWHLLSCVVTFSKPNKISVCDTSNTSVSYSAKKMTSDIAPSIINNAYFKPSYKNPYYSILAVPYESSLDKIIDPCNLDEDDYGYRLNIYCGDDTKCKPTSVYVNYLKTPQKIELKDDDLEGIDNTKVLDFPDYVCYEIINEFVKLLLENTADPRLQTNIPINQTIVPQVSE